MISMLGTKFCQFSVLLCVYLLILVTTACSDENNPNKECEFVIDTVSIIDAKKINDKTYYLVLRIAGFQKKREILELYDSKPEFDWCSRSQAEPVFGDILPKDMRVTHVYLDTNTNSFELIFNNEPSGDNSKLKLELKPN